MTSSVVNNLFSSIEGLVQGGEFNKACIQINKFKKKCSLTAGQRVKISTWYHWMGKSSFALKVLGKATPIVGRLHIDDIKRHIRIAHMYNYFGANKYAKKVYEKIQKYIEQNSVEISKHYPQYYNSLGNFYLQAGEYEKGLEYFRRFKSNKDSYFSQYFFNVLGQTDCLHRLNKGDEAITRCQQLEGELKQGESDEVAAIYYQALGEYYLGQGDLERAEVCLNRSEGLFKQSRTKDFAYLKMYQGALSAKKKNFLKASKLFAGAEDILLNDRFHPVSLIELYQNMERAGVALNDKQLLLLRLEQNSNSFVLENGKLIDIKYDDVENSFFSQKKVIDLKSKIITFDGKVIKKLSALEFRLLDSLVKSSHVGIFSYSLLERIYLEDINNGVDELERLKKLIARVKKLGLKISTTNSLIKLENLEDLTFIIPKNNTL